MVAAAHVSYPVVGVGMVTLDNPPHNHARSANNEHLKLNQGNDIL